MRQPQRQMYEKSGNLAQAQQPRTMLGGSVIQWRGCRFLVGHLEIVQYGIQNRVFTTLVALFDLVVKKLPHGIPVRCRDAAPQVFDEIVQRRVKFSLYHLYQN